MRDTLLRRGLGPDERLYERPQSSPGIDEGILPRPPNGHAHDDEALEQLLDQGPGEEGPVRNVGRVVGRPANLRPEEEASPLPSIGECVLFAFEFVPFFVKQQLEEAGGLQAAVSKVFERYSVETTPLATIELSAADYARAFSTDVETGRSQLDPYFAQIIEGATITELARMRMSYRNLLFMPIHALRISRTRARGVDFSEHRHSTMAPIGCSQDEGFGFRMVLANAIMHGMIDERMRLKDMGTTFALAGYDQGLIDFSEACSRGDLPPRPKEALRCVVQYIVKPRERRNTQASPSSLYNR